MVQPSDLTRRRVLLVGFAGQQGQEYLPIVRRHAEIAGGVDPSPAAAQLARREGFPLYRGLGTALHTADFDTAVVTVPHSEHFPLGRMLLEAGKHVLKEKPFAVTEVQARELTALVERADRSLFTLVQRGFNPVFRFAREQLPRIGEPYWFSYDYHLNLPAPTSGWRAAEHTALGGVLLDMGYHLLDVVSALFPAPAELWSAFVHRSAEMRARRLEDFASVQFVHPPTSLAGSLRISRHHPHRAEQLTVLGTEGALSVGPAEAALYSPDGELTCRLVSEQSKSAAVGTMFAHYFRRLDDRDYRSAHLRHQLATVRLLERSYRNSCGAPKEVSGRPARPARDRVISA